MPVEERAHAVRPGAEREIRDRIRRAEGVSPRIPAGGRTALSPIFSCRRCSLSAGRQVGLASGSHATAIAFDLLVVLGLVLVGRRFGGSRSGGAARVRVACEPVHGLRAERKHERRDHAGRARVGILAVHVSGRSWRGGCARRVGEVRRFPSRPLVADVPCGLRVRAALRFGVAFLLASAASLSILLLEPGLRGAVHRF